MPIKPREKVELTNQRESGGEDLIDTYFECITTCSIDDNECITRCVEVLKTHK